MDANTVGAVATLTGVSVRALHDDAGVDVVAHLLRRHALLTAQAHRLKDMITAVEELMSAHGRGIQLSAEEQVEIFGTTDFGGEYAAEAEQRWGIPTPGHSPRRGPSPSPRTTGCGSRPTATSC